jgi:hypothetical protein
MTGKPVRLRVVPTVNGSPANPLSYDTWKNDRRPIAQISKGDTVFGVTGVVITFAPGVIRVDRDLPDSNLTRGDTILTYTYRGEGFSAVWFKGKYYTEFDISFTKWPDGQGCGGALRSHLCRPRKEGLVGGSKAEIRPNGLGEYGGSRF